MLGRRRRHGAEINGEAVVTAARAAGGTPRCGWALGDGVAPDLPAVSHRRLAPT